MLDTFSAGTSYQVAMDPTGAYSGVTISGSNNILLFPTMNVPSMAPTISSAPTTLYPTKQPVYTPTALPTYPITSKPTHLPTLFPTRSPTMITNLLPFSYMNVDNEFCCSQIATDSEGLNGLGYFSFQLFYFTNYALVWNVANLSPGYPFTAVAVSGSSNLFLAAGGYVLYASTNPSSGVWTTIETLSVFTYISSIGVNYDGSVIVIVSSSSPYAYMSINGGSTFAVLTSLSNAAASHNGLSSVTIDSTGTYITASSSSGYVFVSTDAGATFTSTQVLQTTSPTLIAGSAGNQNQNLYVSSTTSTTSFMANSQQGSTSAWVTEQVNPSSIIPTGLAVTSNGKTVLMSTQNGVYMNSNYGNANDWEVICEGYIYSVAIDSTASNIYLSAYTSVLIYHNGKLLYVLISYVSY